MKFELLCVLLAGLSCGLISDAEAHDHGEIYKPCDVNDLNCIRHFLAANGDCHPMYNNDHNAVYRPRQVAYLPNANITMIFTNSHLVGIESGKIVAFYINQKTNNLVMAVEFKKIILDVERSYWQFQRRAMEPVIVGTYLNATYLGPTMTAVIPMKPGNLLSHARVTAFVADSNPPFYVGPEVTDSKDPVVSTRFLALVSNIPTTLQELFLTESVSYFNAFVQKYICDFLVPISV